MPESTFLLSEGGGFDVFAGEHSYIWTIVIFVLALPFMWKVVFGPITRALDERESRARDAAKAAEAAREETERMKAAIEEDLNQARKEAASQVAEARTRAEAREKEILAKAQAEAEKDRVRAQAEIERALASARETLRSEAVSLGLQVAERVMARKFEQADHDRMVEEFRREFSAS